jgi:hypothetical protein
LSKIPGANFLIIKPAHFSVDYLVGIGPLLFRHATEPAFGVGLQADGAVNGEVTIGGGE